MFSYQVLAQVIAVGFVTLSFMLWKHITHIISRFWGCGNSPNFECFLLLFLFHFMPCNCVSFECFYMCIIRIYVHALFYPNAMILYAVYFVSCPNDAVFSESANVVFFEMGSLYYFFSKYFYQCVTCNVFARVTIVLYFVFFCLYFVFYIITIRIIVFPHLG